MRKRAGKRKRRIFLVTGETPCMERGDLISVAAGIVIVLVVLLVLRPSILTESAGSGDERVTVNTTIMPSPTTVPVVTTASPVRDPSSPFRIVYTSHPERQPNYLLPKNLTFLGGSDLPWDDDAAVFALLQESRGGVTETFAVTYPIWRWNCSIDASSRPQYALLRVALANATDGSILDGAEIRSGEQVSKTVQYSQRDFYFITSCQHVGSFTCTLEYPVPR